MKGKRYTEEFKQEAVKQVTERGYSVADVRSDSAQPRTVCMPG
jgi:transposase-like protein